MDAVRYFCHACQRDVQISRNSESMACPDCHGGFIEELPAPSMQFTYHTAPVFHGLTTPMPSGGATVFHQGPNVITFQSTGPMNFDVMLRQVLGSMPFFMGNPNDYVHNQAEFDNIITQMLNRLDNTGPPPASSEQLDTILKVAVAQDEVDHKAACSICFDEYALQEEVDKLPCGHLFHHNCIIDWLQRHGTCPVCRKTLDGRDTSQQTYNLQQHETTASGSTPSSRAPSTNQGGAPPDPASGNRPPEDNSGGAGMRQFSLD